MRFLEYVEYSVSPTVKFAICLVLFLAIVVVYFWEPKRKRKKKPQLEGIMQHVEVDSREYGEDSMKLLERPEMPLLAKNQTLDDLDDYLKTLKRYHIKNLDDV